MTHTLTKPLSDVGELYRQMRAGEITLEAYIAQLGEDTCATPRCLRPATQIDRGRRYCEVCALRERTRRQRGW